MDKPKDIDLLERFLRLEKKLGHSEEELVERMKNAFLWFSEKRLMDKLNAIDRIAASKLGELISRGITEEVSESLHSE